MGRIKSIQPFLDDKGRIVQLPQKLKLKLMVLAYLAGKFETGRDYSEHEVNAVCGEWHTFGDYFWVRRELVDSGFLCRERDGSRYWKPQGQPAQIQEDRNPNGRTREAGF